MPDGHAAGDGMGVHDQVRHRAFTGEGHVLLRVCNAHGSLLAVARGELVSDLITSSNTQDRHTRHSFTQWHGVYVERTVATGAKCLLRVVPV